MGRPPRYHRWVRAVEVFPETAIGPRPARTGPLLEPSPIQSKEPRMRSARLAVFALLLALPGLSRADSPFYLKDGDRVVFYGDSITDQRLYTTFVETYAVTRFPKLNLSFVHSG